MVDILSLFVQLLTLSQFYNAQILLKNLTSRKKKLGGGWGDGNS